MKQCPFCAEDIQDAAIKCRYCGSQLQVPSPQSAPSPTRRFQSVTEADARLVEEGATIELAAGGYISQRAENLLTEKHVVLVRATPQDECDDVRELVRAGKRIEAMRLLREKKDWGLKEAKDFVDACVPASGAPPAQASGWNRPIGTRTGLGLLATVIGFALTMTSSASAVGIMTLWCGLAFTLMGGAAARWGGGLILALILGAVGISIGRPSAASRVALPSSTAATPPAPTVVVPPPSPQKPAKEPAKVFALVSSQGYESESGSYHIVEGEVKNIADEPLRNVAVVATWYDKDGRFIKSDNALIEYNPLLPGQTSPFKTMSSTNPAMERYAVAFKTFLGSTLACEDQRRK